MLQPPSISTLFPYTTLFRSVALGRRGGFRVVTGSGRRLGVRVVAVGGDRKSTCLNSSHPSISYAVFCLKKKKPLSLDRKSTRLNSSHVCISYAVFCLTRINF